MMKSSTASKPDGRSQRATDMREKRRAAILSAAAQVFAVQGYHEGSVADVIDRAGVSRGTFYLYFDGKRAVFDAILSDMIESLKACLDPVDLTRGTPPFDQLLANIERVFELLLEQRDLTNILFRHAEGIDPGFDAQLKAFYDEVVALIESSLETGIAIGILRSIDIRIAALSVLGAIKQIVSQLAFTQPEAAFDSRHLAQVLLDIHLHGLLR